MFFRVSLSFFQQSEVSSGEEGEQEGGTWGKKRGGRRGNKRRYNKTRREKDGVKKKGRKRGHGWEESSGRTGGI